MGTGEGGGTGSSDNLTMSSHAVAGLGGANPASSSSTPPAPPADFNPPVDASPAVVEATIHGIATPPTSGVQSPASIVSPPPDHPLSPSAAIPFRPAIQALQRVSHDSFASQPSSGSIDSSASTASESADHLAEMRDRLIEGSSQTGSGPPSRDASADNVPALDIRVVQPTPPMRPRGFPTEDNAEAGPSRHRTPASPSPSPAEPDLAGEHAWDSVWPSPAVLARRSSIAPDLGSTRFPTAPLSPFVTPAFSPAMIAGSSSSSRRPPSPGRKSPPGRSRSPRRPSPATGNSPILEAQPQVPELGFPMGRRRSITAATEFGAYSPPTPGSFIMSKHARSFSNSSATSPTHRTFISPKDKARTRKTPPPPSPPQSPRRSLSSLPERPNHSASAKALWRKHTALERSRLGDVERSPPIGPLGMRSHSSRGSAASPNFNPARSPTVLASPAARPVPELAVPPDPVHAQHAISGLKAERTDESASPIPPVNLPPSVADASVIPLEPEPPALGKDSGFPTLLSPHPWPDPDVPLFQPLARPANLRRSVSDFDTKPRTQPKVSPDLPRTSSNPGVIESTRDCLKRTGGTADLPSPTEACPATEPELGRARKSPRLAPSVEPMSTPDGDDGMGISMETPQQDLRRVTERPEVETPRPAADLGLVDEGDVLPEMDFSVEVTFEDEGLNTLERIFLLSKSDFPFHRAYIARVLGDLLYDVDPCESVEYVLPLISSFTIDEDESVKEAFAAELHRILWYFFSTCEVAEGGSEPALAPQEDEVYQPDSVVTVTSEGLEVVDRPSADDLADVPELKVHSPERPEGKEKAEAGTSSFLESAGADHHESDLSGGYWPASESEGTATGSSQTRTNSSGPSLLGHDEPATPDSVFSQDTAYSPAPFVEPFSDDMDPEKGLTRQVGPLAGLPRIPVDFFTPLLGAMLLNANPTIQESVRTGIVSLIGRIRGKGEITAERWGATGVWDPDERRTFASQTGPHSHDIRPMSQHKRDVVEHELLQGIVIGIGHLSVDIPEDLFDTQIGLDDANRALETYADSTGGGHDHAAMEMQHEREAFQAQVIAEATAGRATSVNLIGSLCEFYDGQEAVNRGFVDEVLRCGDGEMATRAEGAVAMSLIAKIAPVEHIYRMIPLFEQLAMDEVSQVRQSTTCALAPLAKRIELQDYRRTFAVKSFRTLVSQPDEVRCAALEVLGELIYVFYDDERGPPPELIEWYLDEHDIGRILDADWEVVASFNFPGIALTLGPKRWDEIRDLYARLNTTTNMKVLRTLAASLHELAKILEPDQVAKDLVPVYTRCVTEPDEIRELIYEHVDDFLRNLPLELAWQTFLSLNQAWEETRLGGWRAREQLALHIPVFFEIFDEKEGVEPQMVLRMMSAALLDPFAAVRDAATKGIPTSYTVLGKSSDIARQFHRTLLDLAVSPVFRRRLTFVRCLREFVKPPPNRSAFEEFFLPALPALCTDIVDVRLGLAQTVADLFVVGAFYGQRVKVPQQILDLAQQLAEDKAPDVRDTVRNVDLKRLHKGEGIPHEVQPTEVPDRASVPSELQPTREASRDSTSRARQNSKPREEDKPVEGNDSISKVVDSISEAGSEPRAIKIDSPTGLTVPLVSSPRGVSPARSPEQQHLPRRPSTEVLSRFSIMRLNSSSGQTAGAAAFSATTLPVPAASPALRTDQLYSPSSGLGTLGSPGPTVLRPGLSRGNSAVRTPGGGFVEGHWYSTPSPTRVPGGMDPFEASFVAATPSVSSASEAGSLDDGITSP